MHFKFPNGKIRTVEAKQGSNLLDVVIDHDVDIDGFGTYCFCFNIEVDFVDFLLQIIKRRCLWGCRGGAHCIITYVVACCLAVKCCTRLYL